MNDPKSLLDEALARGVINDEQRTALASIATEDHSDSEERIKPVGTLNELFITFGVMVLLNALSGLAALISSQPMIAALIASALAYAAAQFFHQGKRFRLPIIYASCSLAISIAMLAHMVFTGDAKAELFDTTQPLSSTVIPLSAAMLALAGMAWRFRIPFLMLPICVLFTIILTYAARMAAEDISYRLILGVAGLAILTMAVRFDVKDPERITRASDFAFWSYVVGSPLFVHSLFLSVLIHQQPEELLHGFEWLGIAALALAVSFVAIVLNRRALILSTLMYVGFVLFRLLSELGSPAYMLLITLVLIGLYVISLGARWQKVRRYILLRLPSWPWLKALPKA